jgi:hypothetical protein
MTEKLPRELRGMRTIPRSPKQIKKAVRKIVIEDVKKRGKDILGAKKMKDGGLAEAIEKVKAKEMEKGGEVPSKFKGFSKLPEEVQKKMDPALAERFEDGGPVKMGSGGGVCKGMGIARAGGKFKVR